MVERYLGVEHRVAPVEKSLAGGSSLIVIVHDLEAKDQGPDETEDKLDVTVMDILSTNTDELNALLLNVPESVSDARKGGGVRFSPKKEGGDWSSVGSYLRDVLRFSMRCNFILAFLLTLGRISSAPDSRQHMFGERGRYGNQAFMSRTENLEQSVEKHTTGKVGGEVLDGHVTLLEVVVTPTSESLMVRRTSRVREEKGGRRKKSTVEKGK